MDGLGLGVVAASVVVSVVVVVVVGAGVVEVYKGCLGMLNLCLKFLGGRLKRGL